MKKRGQAPFLQDVMKCKSLDKKRCLSPFLHFNQRLWNKSGSWRLNGALAHQGQWRSAMRKFTILGLVAGLTMVCCGCELRWNPQLADELGQQIVTNLYERDLAPIYAAVMIGELAPTGGLPIINAFYADSVHQAMWETSRFSKSTSTGAIYGDPQTQVENGIGTGCGGVPDKDD
jgi:hypothetical protein